MSAPSKTWLQDTAHIASDDRRRAVNAFGCAELLKRLIEHHPHLPIGVCRTPGTRRPIRLGKDRSELQRAARFGVSSNSS
jgi:hypothetical protein